MVNELAKLNLSVDDMLTKVAPLVGAWATITMTLLSKVTVDLM